MFRNDNAIPLDRNCVLHWSGNYMINNSITRNSDALFGNQTSCSLCTV